MSNDPIQTSRAITLSSLKMYLKHACMYLANARVYVSNTSYFHYVHAAPIDSCILFEKYINAVDPQWIRYVHSVASVRTIL